MVVCFVFGFCGLCGFFDVKMTAGGDFEGSRGVQWCGLRWGSLQR